MTSQSNSRPVTNLELAIGLATYDKLPLAIKVGAIDQIQSGELEYALEFIDPCTGTYWNATSRCIIDQESGNLIVQFWDEIDTGREADFDLVQQSSIVLQAFAGLPEAIGRRIFVQAIEWIEIDN